MRKILIFGNSGSGKSTLAKKYNSTHGLAHLDLDNLAWSDTIPTSRKPLAESALQIEKFLSEHQSWVIEGCYTDLLEVAAPYSLEIIYMDLPIELCIENARKRPWEPHKYESKEAQDANLEMLIEWIKQYSIREDNFSKIAHTDFFNSYQGKKHRITANS